MSIEASFSFVRVLIIFISGSTGLLKNLSAHLFNWYLGERNIFFSIISKFLPLNSRTLNTIND